MQAGPLRGQIVLIQPLHSSNTKIGSPSYYAHDTCAVFYWFIEIKGNRPYRRNKLEEPWIFEIDAHESSLGSYYVVILATGVKSRDA